jgi:hypothetical protein
MANSHPPRPSISSSRLSGTALALSGTLAVALQAGIPLLAGEIASLAVADDGTPLGSIAAGSFVSTQVSDDVAEELREMLTSGSPKTRKSMLEHTWRFDVTGGNNYQLAVEAWHTPNTEHDDFRFSFSRDDLNYTPILTVTAVADPDAAQTAGIPVDASGSIYIRVEDTDETAGGKVADSLFVDSLAVLSDDTGPDVTPPSPAFGLTATPGDSQVALAWSDWGEWDLEGARVYRSSSTYGPWTLISSAPAAGGNYVDDTAANLTIYYYRVEAVDLAGNLSAPSAAVLGVPRPAGSGAVLMHVSKLAVSAQSVASGWRQGRADVTVVDENGAPVAGALVTGTFSGAISQTKSATTDAKGFATIVSTQALKAPSPSASA